jgi:hypothetical protein
MKFSTRRRFATLLLSLPGWVCLRPRASRAAIDFGAAGDRVICLNRHPIARLNRSLYPTDKLPLSTFSDWRITPPTTLNPAPPCPRCGKIWYQSDTRTGLPAVNIEGKGWLPYDPTDGRMGTG